MSSALGTAFLAASATLVVAYLTNFEKERYVRFLDAASLAGALAGELRSHRSAFPVLLDRLHALEKAASSGAAVPLRLPTDPTSPIFESCVAKLGLLGPERAEAVAFLYEQLRAFRATMKVIAQQQEGMTNEELAGRYAYARQMIEDNQPGADAAIASLSALSRRRYVPSFCVLWQRALRSAPRKSV